MTLFNIARAHVDPMAQAVRFYVAQETRFTRLADRRVLTEEGIKDFRPQRGEYIDPSFNVDMEAAQQLFESLWAQGFRSVHDKGNADKLDDARQAHIDDLRKVAKIA
jgi:hypothetical protein